MEYPIHSLRHRGATCESLSNAVVYCYITATTGTKWFDHLCQLAEAYDLRTETMRTPAVGEVLYSPTADPAEEYLSIGFPAGVVLLSKRNKLTYLEPHYPSALMQRFMLETHHTHGDRSISSAVLAAVYARRLMDMAIDIPNAIRHYGIKHLAADLVANANDIGDALFKLGTLAKLTDLSWITTQLGNDGFRLRIGTGNSRLVVYHRYQYGTTVIHASGYKRILPTMQLKCPTDLLHLIWPIKCNPSNLLTSEDIHHGHT